MNKKVYCNNCKNLGWHSWNENIVHHCKAVIKRGEYREDTPRKIIKFKTKTYGDHEELNENNDCKNYEKKRWKIWIKN